MRFSWSAVDPKRRSKTLARDGQRLLAQLNATGGNADDSRLGDSAPLPRHFDVIPRGEVVKRFGPSFAARLDELPTGRWEGPIESGLGEHLVFLSARIDGGAPTLDAVRDEVRREWANARRLEANEAFYRGLLAKYDVTVEGR